MRFEPKTSQSPTREAGMLTVHPRQPFHLQLCVLKVFFNNFYIVSIRNNNTSESKSLPKECASSLYLPRKKVIEYHASLTFFLHRCPAVHISKREHPNIKTIGKFDCTRMSLYILILCAGLNIGAKGQPLQKNIEANISISIIIANTQEVNNICA